MLCCNMHRNMDDSRGDGLVFLLFIWQILKIMQKTLRENSRGKIDSMLLIESIFCGFLAIFLVFFVNEMGQRFTDKLNGADDFVSQLNW